MYRCAAPWHRANPKRQEISLPKVPVISILDDDKSMREATSALVRSLGYAVATFASAEDFLESDRVDDTSCLITDVQMPGLSGVRAAKSFDRRRPAHANHWGHGIFGRKHPDAVLRAGAIGFLSKPFNDECLIDCLTTL